MAVYRNNFCHKLIVGDVPLSFPKVLLMFLQLKASKQRCSLGFGDPGHLRLRRTKSSSSVYAKKDKWVIENHREKGKQILKIKFSTTFPSLFTN